MDYTICTSAGKFSKCKACPLSKPHAFGGSFICPINNLVITKSTKIHGTLIREKDKKTKSYDWKFKTEYDLVLDLPIINKTDHRHLAHPKHERPVVAWVTSEGIEIIRFDNRPINNYL